MTWWQKLRKNSLAQVGALILLMFYLIVFLAEFTAPYDPYFSEPSASLLPPTAVYWRHQTTGEFLGPHVYPTTQGPVSIETGEREVFIDFEQPSPIRLLVKGDEYRWLRLELPLPTKFSLSEPSFDEVEILPGISGNVHLFGTVGPGRWNILGTDEQARDQLSRLIYGGRISLSIGLIGIALSFPLGMLVGGLAGYFGGWIDAVLMRLVEVIMTIPAIFLLVALAAVLPATLSSTQRFLLIILITSFVRWTSLARVVRGQVLALKSQTFVTASQAMGGQSIYIIVRHILPQTATYVIISATLAIPSFIVAEAVLSLIGLGIQQPDPSWGNMLSLASNASILVLNPWLIWPPAILIVLTVLSFNLLGDGLRDALDPRSLQSYD
ncbi:MAG: ABC transporter permease [Leptolyngbya sp. SIOISBB]|nr:ABC transporter permease [Leptolyngbya sp. SIOISBB]